MIELSFYDNDYQSTGDILPARSHLAMSGNIFGCHNCVRGKLLASSGIETRMLLNILHCIRQPPTTKNYPALGSPGGAVVKNPPANAGDTGSIPGPGRSHMPQSN